MGGVSIELATLVLTVVGGAVAFLPNISTRNRNVAIAGAVVSGALTIFGWYLVSSTGRDLFDHTACTVFSEGAHCQANRPLTAENVIGDWEGAGAVGRADEALQRMTLNNDGGVFVPTEGFSGEWSIAQNDLRVRIVCGPPACAEGQSLLFTGRVIDSVYRASSQTNENQSVQLTMRRVPRARASPADYMN